MARITAEELRALFPMDDSSRSVDQYVEAANLLVTETLSTSGLSPERLALVEKYLAAHLYVLSEQEGGIFEEKIGEASTKMGSTFALGQGLLSTRFGQLAMGLDPTGSLEGLSASKKKRAEFRVV